MTKSKAKVSVPLITSVMLMSFSSDFYRSIGRIVLRLIAYRQNDAHDFVTTSSAFKINTSHFNEWVGRQNIYFGSSDSSDNIREIA